MIAAVSVNAAQTASTTVYYSFAKDNPPNSGGINSAYMSNPLPDIEIPAGGVISVRFVNRQGTDDCGPIAYSYKEAPA
jgi:hypothetical protein